MGDPVATDDLTRLRIRQRDRFDCQIAGQVLCWRKNDGDWQQA